MLEIKLAHPGRRYQGQFIDGLVSLVIFALGIYFVQMAGYNSDKGIIMVVLLSTGYFVFSDSLPNGQSIGKRLLGIAVVSKTTGERCSVLQSLVRNIFTPFLGVIDAIIILGKKRQRLGDVMANTIVIDLR